MTKQQIIRSACIVGITSGALVCVWQTQQKLYAGRLMVLTFDEQLSPAATKTATNLIDTCLTRERVTDAPTLLTKLQQEIPTLTNVTMNYRIPGKVKINLACARPSLVVKPVNQTPILLTEYGVYAPYQQYKPDMLRGLPSLLITEENFNTNSRSALYNWFTTLPDDFFAKYSAQWNKPTEIIIRDTAQSTFDYILMHTTPWTPLLEQQCALARTAPLPNNKQKKYKKWVIDTRFKDQLIIKGVV